MTDYAAFFLSSAPSVLLLDCVEITHPDFSQDYFIVRNGENGVSVTHEGDVVPTEYEYFPVRVIPMSAQDDLVQALQITLGDVGNVIADEIKNVWEANGMDDRPALVFRQYPSDALDEPVLGPITLEIANVTTSKEGAAFEARSPELNASRTGLLYSVKDFPMLRGFS